MSGIKGLLTAVLAEMRAKFLAADEGSPSVPGGIGRLIAGCHPGALVVIGGRPEMGKSALAYALAARIGCERPVVVLSLAAPAADVGRRMLAAEARVDGGRMVSGDLSDGDLDRIHSANVALSGRMITVLDGDVDVDELRAQCWRRAAAAPLGAVIIDYLQLMRPGRCGDVRGVIRGLKAMAITLDAPVIVVSEIGVAPEGRADKRPRAADVSDPVRYAADMILLMYRHEYYHPDAADGLVEVAAVKRGGGAFGGCSFRFFPEWSGIADPPSPCGGAGGE